MHFTPCNRLHIYNTLNKPLQSIPYKYSNYFCCIEKLKVFKVLIDFELNSLPLAER